MEQDTFFSPCLIGGRTEDGERVGPRIREGIHQDGRGRGAAGADGAEEARREAQAQHE